MIQHYSGYIFIGAVLAIIVIGILDRKHKHDDLPWWLF
jgi:hypothetical protein